MIINAEAVTPQHVRFNQISVGEVFRTEQGEYYIKSDTTSVNLRVGKSCNFTEFCPVVPISATLLIQKELRMDEEGEL